MASSSPTPQLPWIVHSDGSFVTLPDLTLHCLSLPDKTRIVGATNGYLVLDRTDAEVGRYWLPGARSTRHTHTYSLHNPLSGATLPLPGLDSVAGDVSGAFKIRKVLMRSTAGDDIMAVTTNSWDCPVILCRPGKPGAWLPEPREMPYARIFDVAFHGGRLYGATSGEGLVAMDLGDDGEGRPVVTGAKYVIQPHPDVDEDGDSESEVSSSEDDDDDEGEVSSKEDDDEDGDSEVSSNEDDDDEDGDSEVSSSEDDDDEDEVSSNEDEEGSDSDFFNGDGMVPPGQDYAEDEAATTEPKDIITTTRHLLESNGKLLMVRREEQVPPFSPSYNRKVEAFEADMDAGVCVPVAAGGIFDGQTLFISKHLSKSVSGLPEAEKKGLTCCFVDEYDEIDMEMEIGKPLHEAFERNSTWFFPPEFVV